MLIKKLFFLVFLAFLLASPILLGFYHDDWSTIVGSTTHGVPWSWSRLIWTMSLFLSRPVSGFLLYFFSSLAEKSPILWHASISILALLGVVVLARFFQALAVFFHQIIDKLDSFFFAALLFLLPWTFGATLFLTAAFEVIPAMIFFVLAAIFAIKYVTQGRLKLLLASAFFYLLSCLTYEAFYFQFLTLSFLILVNRSSRQTNLKRTIIIFFILSLAQLGAVVWNRYIAATVPGSGSKPFNTSWWPLFSYSLVNLPSRLESSLSEVLNFWQWIKYGYAVTIFIGFYTLFLKSSSRVRVLLSMLVVLGGGVVFAVLTYAVAGYGLTGVGIFSRTTFSVSFFLICGLYVIDLCFLHLSSSMGTLYRLVSTAAVLALLISSGLRFMDWTKSWQIQTLVINSAPVNEIKQTDPQAVILYQGPTEENGVTVFQAFWDISGAINYSYHNLDQRRYSVARSDWITIFRQGRVIQSWRATGQGIWSLPASETWVWNYWRGTFTPLPPDVPI